MKKDLKKQVEKPEKIEETQEQKEARWAKNRKLAKHFAKIYY
jgi:hypothetical protein